MPRPASSVSFRRGQGRAAFAAAIDRAGRCLATIKWGVEFVDWLFPSEGKSSADGKAGGPQDLQGDAQAAQEAANAGADKAGTGSGAAAAGKGSSTINSMSDWVDEAQKGLDSYRDSAGGVAGAMESLFTDAFSKMGDAVVNFAQTGKLDFSDFAQSVIEDLIKIQTRAALSGLAQMGISRSAACSAAASGAARRASSIA